MKLLPVVVALAVGLAACGKKEPAPTAGGSADSAPLVDNKAIADQMAAQRAASEKATAAERDAAEKKQAVDGLYDVARRWDNAVETASKTARPQLDAAIKSLQTIKGEADAVAVNECTGKARALLVQSMNASIEAFTRFKGEAGDASEATNAKNKEAANLLAESSAALAECK